jgi:peptidoglycan hydrolase-like protein with peptidoglycan-binding domain
LLTVSNSEYYSNFRNTIAVTLVDDDSIHASRSGSVHYSCKDPLATNYESLGASKPSLCIYPTVAKQVDNVTVSKDSNLDLSFGMKNDNVLKLQRFLIAQNVGIGAKKLSNNVATGYFGLLTKNALIEYQIKFGIVPATGRFGPMTRAQIKASGVAGLWW